MQKTALQGIARILRGRLKSNINNTTQFFVPRISEAVCVKLVFLSEMASENLACVNSFLNNGIFLITFSFFIFT